MLQKIFRKVYLNKNPFTKKSSACFRFFSIEQVQLPQKLFEKQDFLAENYNEIMHYAIYANSEDKILELFKNFGSRMPIDVVADVTDSIVFSQIDLSQRFNEKCVPIICSYLQKINRDNSLSFGRMMSNFALMEINSPVLWETIFKVFADQKMERYIPIDLLAGIMIHFSMWKNPNRHIFDVVMPVLILHRFRLNSAASHDLVKAMDRIDLPKYKELLLEENKGENVFGLGKH